MKVAYASALLLAVTLAGCNSSAPPPEASAPVAAPARQASLDLPAGAPCSADVSRWQTIAQSDRDTGNVGSTVYNEIEREISAAAAACRAGKDGEARALITSSKRRHGYPA